MTQHFHAAGVSGPCPDVDTLADLQAGVLDATTATQLRAHTDACAACTEVLAALDATVASLGALPQVQVPPDVAARIDRALAVEAGRLDAGTDQPRPFAVSPPTAASNVDRRGADRPRQAGPELRAHGGPQPQQDHGGASNVASLSAHREKKAGRGRLLLAAAAAAAVIGGGTLILTQNDGGDAASNQAGTSQSADAGAQNDTQGEPAPGQVQTFSSPADVLDRGAIENDEVSPEVAGQMAELSARNQCLSQIVPRPASAPEAVQAGSYQGDEAYAFVFPTGDPQVVEMIVVEAADCSNILHKESGPRN